MDCEDKEFLDELAKVFEDKADSLQQAFKTLEENNNEGGMLFSKEFRDHMAPFGDKNAVELLKDRNFWNHLAKYAGISEEELQNLSNKQM